MRWKPVCIEEQKRVPINFKLQITQVFLYMYTSKAAFAIVFSSTLVRLRLVSLILPPSASSLAARPESVTNTKRETDEHPLQFVIVHCATTLKLPTSHRRKRLLRQGNERGSHRVRYRRRHHGHRIQRWSGWGLRRRRRRRRDWRFRGKALLLLGRRANGQRAWVNRLYNYTHSGGGGGGGGGGNCCCCCCCGGVLVL